MSNQHYVPYFYLKEFALKEYSKQEQRDRLVKLNVFRKSRERKSEEFAGELASEIGFYEQITDDILGEIEKDIARIYKNIIKDSSITNFNDVAQKERFSFFLASQMNRTKFSKDLVIPSLKKSWIERGYTVTDDDEKIFNKTLGPEYILINSQCLLIKKWKLIKNNTSNPFWSSDNPVLWIPDRNKSKNIYSGGIFFPISPKLCLYLYDDESQDIFKDDDLVFIKSFNSILLYMSKNMIFSNKAFPNILRNKDLWSIDWENKNPKNI